MGDLFYFGNSKNTLNFKKGGFAARKNFISFSPLINGSWMFLGAAIGLNYKMGNQSGQGKNMVEIFCSLH